MKIMAAAAHVVCRAVCTFEDEDSQVRLDEAARRLILIRHREFVALPLGSLGQAPSAAADAGTIRCDNGGKVENLRFSLTHRFVAVQRSDTTLELVDLTQGNTFTHVCRGGGSKARWRILGFQWTGTPVSDLLVVTSAGVEFYLVLPERCALKLVKTVQHAVSWCVYSHETRLLLLATGPQDTVIHGIQVQPTAIVRIPKFEVQLAPVADVADAPDLAQPQNNGPKRRRSLLPTELSAARLYNMIFCVHIDPERQQVLLYQLFKDFVVRKFALHLYSRHVAIRYSHSQYHSPSVVDNLLLTMLTANYLLPTTYYSAWWTTCYWSTPSTRMSCCSSTLRSTRSTRSRRRCPSACCLPRHGARSTRRTGASPHPATSSTRRWAWSVS